MKRTVSICIALVMLISLFPLSVFADDISYLPVAPPPPPQEDMATYPTPEEYNIDPEPVDTREASNDLMHSVFGADKDEKE